jgi:hypothetical protein
VRFLQAAAPQHFRNFLPLRHGQKSLGLGFDGSSFLAIIEKQGNILHRPNTTMPTRFMKVWRLRA